MFKTIAVVTLLFSGLFVVARLLAVLVLRSDGAPSKKANQTALAKSVLVVVALIGALRIVRLHHPAASIGDSIPAAGVLTAVSIRAVAMAAIAVCGIAALKRGLRPAIDQLRPGKLTVPVRIRRRNRLLGVGIAFVIALCIELIAAGVVPLSNWWGLTLALVLGQGVYGPLSAAEPDSRSRDPTDEEQGRIKRCFDRFGRSPPPLFVTVNEELYRKAEVCGYGDHRTLVVQESFLESATDEEMTVLLANADERNRRGSSLLYSWALASAFGAIPLLVNSLINLTNEIILSDVGFLLVILAFFLPRMVRQRVHEADRWASEQLGVGTVRTVYQGLETNAQLRAVEEMDIPILGYILRSVVPIPSIDRRIERLEDGSATGDQNGSGERKQPAN